MCMIVSHAVSFKTWFISEMIFENNELFTHKVAGDGCGSHSLWERKGGLL